MIKTLRLSFALKNTYRVNSILYSIKQIPLLKKIIPASIYQMRGFKILANIISGIGEVASTFVGKMLYFFVMIYGISMLYEMPEGTESQLFLHILLSLSVIGSFTNTFMFNPTKDKYYAMILLGMDAKEYTLINYFYAILKVLLGFTLGSLLFGLQTGLPVWQCLLIPFFVAGVKITDAAMVLRKFEKRGTAVNENKLDIFKWVIVAFLLGIAYGLPALGLLIPLWISVAMMVVGILLGGLSVRKILTFKHYRAMYKELLADVLIIINPAGQQTKILKEHNLKNISTDVTIESNKKGFEYLNELFIMRHKKILWKSVKKIAVICLCLIAVMLVVFRIYPEAKDNTNEMLMSALPISLFVMYIINRGTSFTQALFVNCDHSLLTYSFYKEPKFILQLFWIRLREIMKINLLPAAVIGFGLALLLFASGGTKDPMNYVVLVVSMVCLSMFFSVHYLTVYYLLQPYNAGTEIKSGMYQVINMIVYIVCYGAMQVQAPTLIFGIATIIFCVLYCLVASVLVYKYAPKTFKIRV